MANVETTSLAILAVLNRSGGRVTKIASMFPNRIISGGQTGVDRAALDVALELGKPIGGHLPKGRMDENGDVLPENYTGMQETDTDDVKVRTELNVQDSDATLIFSHGPLFGGPAYTEDMARKHGKPCLHIDFDRQEADQAVLRLTAWLLEAQPRVLNVAGPRASDDPAIYSKARSVLAGALASVHELRSATDGLSSHAEEGFCAPHPSPRG